MKFNFLLRRFIFCLLLLASYDLQAINGYISLDKNITDVSWSFLPETNTSFKYSESSSNKFLIYHKRFGVKLDQSVFNLDLERSIQPKVLNLNANSNSIELFNISDDLTSTYSLTFKTQSSDPQKINCYTFSTLTVGSCSDARFNVTNNKPKYDILGDSLLSITGANKSLRIQNIKAVNTLFIDEFSLYLEVTENSFNWISPIEEITTGFIGNLTFSGQRVGDLIASTIKILPQREEWYTTVAGFSFKKSFNVTAQLAFFYNPTVILVKQIDYLNINKIPKYNINLKAGLEYSFKNIDLLIYGSYYQKNLYGFEHIAFNQRSEHHFDSDYGAIGATVTYSF